MHHPVPSITFFSFLSTGFFATDRVWARCRVLIHRFVGIRQIGRRPNKNKERGRTGIAHNSGSIAIYFSLEGSSVHGRRRGGWLSLQEKPSKSEEREGILNTDRQRAKAAKLASTIDMPSKMARRTCTLGGDGDDTTPHTRLSRLSCATVIGDRAVEVFQSRCHAEISVWLPCWLGAHVLSRLPRPVFQCDNPNETHAARTLGIPRDLRNSLILSSQLACYSCKLYRKFTAKAIKLQQALQIWGCRRCDEPPSTLIPQKPRTVKKKG